MHFGLFKFSLFLAVKHINRTQSYPISLQEGPKSVIDTKMNRADTLLTETEARTEAEETTNEILALPPAMSDGSGTVRQFTFGDTLKLDELGPIIINTDGTTRRISNWDQLTKHEQDTTWRVIRARNKKRLEELKVRELESTIPNDTTGGSENNPLDYVDDTSTADDNKDEL